MALISTAPRVDQAGEVRSARVESLRALAALGVLASHIPLIAYGFLLPDLNEHTLLRTVFAGGARGVDLFFVLSGYLLYRPFARRDLSHEGSVDLRRYAINRALRIAPLYLVVVAVLLMVDEGGGTLRDWLLLGTFSGNFAYQSVGHVLPLTWSLVVELHFYLVLPLLAAALGAAGRGSPRRALLALASIAFRRSTPRSTRMTRWC